VLQDARQFALSDHVIEWQGKPCADSKKGFAELAIDAGFCRMDRVRKGQETKRATIRPHGRVVSCSGGAGNRILAISGNRR
jgi:hypothetical protein